ncbi:MAG TPA: primosomal protein N' [Candidatus Hydrogenedentes bacterium]|nr:primosomal protein N' [Candidatus Hydrogenedentota bacterium]
MAAHPFAEVALPLPVDRLFTYAIPDALADRAVPGMRVIVPLRNKIETGYIVSLSNSSPVESPRRIIDLPDRKPIFASDMIRLCRWIADYYCCSFGEALQTAVPAGLKMRTTMRYTLQTELLTGGRYSDRQRRVIAELFNRGPLTDAQLAAAVGRTSLSNTLQSLVARGVLFAEPVVTGPGVSIAAETYARLIEENVPGAEELERLQRTAPKQAAVYLDLLHNDPDQPAALLHQKHDVTSAVLAALEKRGFIERYNREYWREPEFHADPRAREKLRLNAEQQAAFDAISGAMARGEFKTFLLHGVTGSGKTEVYLQAIEYALSLDRGAILLVPEISLTPQTVGRFVARFQERIAVLHSALGKGERYDEWRRAQSGEVRIVVGARSAIFAPLHRLGIVIVDEEHDTSYKQGDTPRYHARDVAVMRAKMAGAVCVLGSATPSIESYYNTEIEKFTRLNLPNRATRGHLPQVRLVDMRVETKELGGQVILSRILEEEINRRVDAREQVILLLNRRGHSPFVLCPKCGWVAECTECSVSLTYHARGAFLGCHYCNARREIPPVCGDCGFNPLLFLGTGTQKVEEYLMRAFREARVERMDADTTAGKGGHAKILGRFAAGDIDILIGTQMIAKGHDYPGVTLVGVLNADTSLALPDFRAAEQTFQLITQVAGRAGRGDRPGEVVVQTYRPNHYAIQAAMRHDYAAFYAREIAERRAAAYPPIRRMANFAVECEKPDLAGQAAGLIKRIVREQIETLGFKGVETIGPAPAIVARVMNKYRWNLGVLSRSAKRLNALARAAREEFHARPDMGAVQLKVDLDPHGIF